ncbi:MAG: hypothetical protein H5T61_10025 [Thermoflexales bacterium]|nr:hypothetical protein [Thermoflexales bacterium]
MRPMVWLRIVVLLGMLFLIVGGGTTAAQTPPGGENDGEAVYPVRQNDGAIRPADAPAACTRIGFNNSLNGWTVHNGEWYTGTDYIYTYGSVTETVSISYDMDLTRTDFQARMLRRGCNDCSAGIVIRGNPEPLFNRGTWDTMYGLYYRANGKCAVVRTFYYGGTHWIGAFLYLTDCPSIVQGEAWNTLRAVADGNQLSFYINDQLIWSGQDPYNANPHGRVGIVMRRSEDPSVQDELRVEWASLCWPYAAFLPVVARR